MDSGERDTALVVIQGCVDIGEWEKGRKPEFDNIATTQKIMETLLAPI